jgi:hypothetical protein
MAAGCGALVPRDTLGPSGCTGTVTAVGPRYYILWRSMVWFAFACEAQHNQLLAPRRLLLRDREVTLNRAALLRRNDVAPDLRRTLRPGTAAWAATAVFGSWDR